DIAIIPLSQLTGCEEAAHHFAVIERDSFSAATVFNGRRRTIVHNDVHLLGRQHSNISHELAHGLLNHAPGPALDDRGCRVWDPEVEAEATYLGAVMLATHETALNVVRRGLSVPTAAGRYGVSDRLMAWMINDS